MNTRNILRLIVTLIAATSVAAEHSQSIANPQTPALFVTAAKLEEKTDVVSKVYHDSASILPRGGKSIVKSTPFISRPASVLMGMILALNSGFINGCALSGAIAATGKAQAVAAVTASWTNSAMGLASGDTAKFGFLGKIIVSFVSGSFVAGFLSPKPEGFLVSTSSFGLPLGIAAVGTLLAKQFLDDTSSVKLGFHLLAFANGINNSVTSTMTSNLCRTSHFTGISSDIGTFLGQVARGNKANIFKLKVFTGLAACFWSGGYLSYGLSKEHGSSILFAPAVVYLFVALGYDKAAKQIFS